MKAETKRAMKSAAVWAAVIAAIIVAAAYPVYRHAMTTGGFIQNRSAFVNGVLLTAGYAMVPGMFVEIQRQKIFHILDLFEGFALLRGWHVPVASWCFYFVILYPIAWWRVRRKAKATADPSVATVI
jgi:hypothetical protein